MRLKTRRLRGSKSHGRGWKSSKHKGGSRGGVGNSGREDHKRISAILEKKNQEKKVVNIRDLESKMDRYVQKGLVRKYVQKTEKGPQNVYVLSRRLGISKILAVGEPSGRYVVPRTVKLSKSTSMKVR